MVSSARSSAVKQRDTKRCEATRRTASASFVLSFPHAFCAPSSSLFPFHQVTVTTVLVPSSSASSVLWGHKAVIRLVSYQSTKAACSSSGIDRLSYVLALPHGYEHINSNYHSHEFRHLNHMPAHHQAQAPELGVGMDLALIRPLLERGFVVALPDYGGQPDA